MRHSAFVLASALILSTASVAFGEPKVGEMAPAFTAVDSNGAKVSLSDFQGKHVVLEWTNADCPFVKKHYGAGNMQALQKDAKAKGVVWLSVISSAKGKQGHVDGAGANKLTADRMAAPAHVLLDESGAIGKAYGAKTTPHMFLIDPSGKVAYMGGIDSVATSDAADIAGATPYLKNAMEAALNGKKIAESNTRPYGCNVKYSE
jgi:peroxiredoxin